MLVGQAKQCRIRGSTTEISDTVEPLHKAGVVGPATSPYNSLESGRVTSPLTYTVSDKFKVTN